MKTLRILVSFFLSHLFLRHFPILSNTLCPLLLIPIYTCFISFVHHSGGLLSYGFVSLGLHFMIFSVNLSSFSLAILPAYCHFSSVILSIISFTLVLPISSFPINLCLKLIPNFSTALSIPLQSMLQYVERRRWRLDILGSWK